MCSTLEGAGLPLNFQSPEKFIHFGPEPKAICRQEESWMGWRVNLFMAGLVYGGQKRAASVQPPSPLHR